jgi:hypothetical protein
MIGSIPRLRNLDLRLDRGRKLPFPYGTSRKTQTRSLFINCAMDESLARSIFAAIEVGKPPGGACLEELKLEVTRLYAFDVAHEVYGEVLEVLSPPWIVRRNVRHNRRSELDANVGLRRTNQPDLRPSLLTPRTEKLIGWVGGAFRDLWPLSGEKDLDWWKSWHSFPLNPFNGTNSNPCLVTRRVYHRS